MFHDFGPFPRIARQRLWILRVRQHDFESVAADLLPVQGGYRLFRALLARVLGVAAGLPGQQVDVDQLPEPTEHVLEDVYDGVVWRAHDEEPLRHRGIRGGEGLGRREFHGAVGWVVCLGDAIGGGGGGVVVARRLYQGGRLGDCVRQGLQVCRYILSDGRGTGRGQPWGGQGVMRPGWRGNKSLVPGHVHVIGEGWRGRVLAPHLLELDDKSLSRRILEPVQLLLGVCGGLWVIEDDGTEGLARPVPAPAVGTLQLAVVQARHQVKQTPQLVLGSGRYLRGVWGQMGHKLIGGCGNNNIYFKNKKGNKRESAKEKTKIRK